MSRSESDPNWKRMLSELITQTALQSKGKYDFAADGEDLND